MNEIFSIIPTNPSDYFTQNFCECNHLIETEHSLGTCYGLDNKNGIVKGCDCKNPRPINVFIRLETLNENSSTNST